MNIKAGILAIDCSTSILKIGLSLDEKSVMLSNDDRYRHAEFIFKLIDQILEENSFDRNGLKLITVCIGPGSFTGLRVGLAAAKGLAVSLKIPIVGISTFSIAAPSLFGKYENPAVVIPSRKNEFYFGEIVQSAFDDSSIKIYSGDELKEISKNFTICPVDLKPEDMELFDKIVENPEEIIVSDNLIGAGYNKHHSSGSDDLSKLEPLYIQQFPVGKK